ncbi:MAG: hypothetical protein WKG01_29125 [Kofleriaceae bacterium]
MREIVTLSIAHRVLTRFTAFVAVDSARVTAQGPAKRVVVPVEVPESARAIASGIGRYGTIGAGYGAGAGMMGSQRATAPRSSS